MKISKGLNELGKGFINIGVAFVIFAIIQPFVKENITLKVVIASIIFSIIFFSVGVILSSINGDEND